MGLTVQYYGSSLTVGWRQWFCSVGIFLCFRNIYKTLFCRVSHVTYYSSNLQWLKPPRTTIGAPCVRCSCWWTQSATLPVAAVGGDNVPYDGSSPSKHRGRRNTANQVAFVATVLSSRELPRRPENKTSVDTVHRDTAEKVQCFTWVLLTWDL